MMHGRFLGTRGTRVTRWEILRQVNGIRVSVTPTRSMRCHGSYSLPVSRRRHAGPAGGEVMRLTFRITMRLTFRITIPVITVTGGVRA
eukprot:1047252-Rhodomonas_salina.4